MDNKNIIDYDYLFELEVAQSRHKPIILLTITLLVKR